MIGLDTNILVRYFVQDDPDQARRARDVIERRLTEQNPGYVSVVVMAEITWVLKSVYGFTDIEIAAAIERMLQADVLVVESERDVFTAMVALKERRGSFADALIVALCASAGCSRVLTFDKAALRLEGFELA